ncbi:hypothetical protein [Flavobacterium sp.]|uniref:hypothetical protein n=1 Tax=Flavobacterium sp. TaxID=239 RepID=UPI00286DD28A|nr:hypothetical protein [Flavobacterium sp.]
MNWTENDLKNLKGKGFKVDDRKIPEENKPKIVIVKRSIEKDTIHAILDMFKLTNQIKDFETELQFSDGRRFRFDWAIPSLRIAIEYEGVFSKKSRHTTVNGFSEDCVKYNLAVCSGWRVLRYTAKNYLNLETDLIKML